MAIGCLTTLLCLSLYLSLPLRSGAVPQITSVESSAILDPTLIRVGRVDDVIVEVQCTDASTATWVFSNGTAITDTLQLTGISQQDGVLRIYPVSYLVASPQFQCNNVSVTFEVVDSLFFIDLQASITSAEAASFSPANCTLPEIPAAAVSVMSTASNVYCLATTARGTFRSPDIPIMENNTLQFTTALNPQTVVDVGSSVNFTCMAAGDPAPGPNQWLRNNTTVNAGVDGFSFPDGDSATRLLLASATFAHSGFYQCVVQEAGDMSSTAIVSSTYLIVRSAGSVNVSASTNTVILREPTTPTNITLTCAVTDSNPLPTITWTGPGQMSVQQSVTGFMETATSSLVVDTTALAGGMNTFTCTSTVEGGVTEQGSIDITAYSPVTISGPQSIPPLIVGDLANFSCSATSIPPPTVTWFRLETGSFNTLMDGESGISITASTPGDDVDSMLVVTVTDESFTQYFCTGDNGFDSSNGSFVDLVRAVPPTLSTQFPPIIAYTPGNSIDLTCTFTGLPQPTIRWLFREDPDTIFNSVTTPVPVVEVDNGANVTVSSTFPFFAVTFSARQVWRCEATNTAGTNSDTVEIFITLAPTLASQLPTRVINCPGDSVQLNCSFTGLPQPNLVWQFREDPNASFTGLSNQFVASPDEVVVDNGANVTVSSTLTFSSDNVSRWVELQCEATNTAGNNSVIVESINAPLPGSPAPVNVANIAARSVDLSWNESSSLLPILGYQVSVRNSSGIEVNTTTVNGTSTTVMGLKPATNYTATVTPTNCVGDGDSDSEDFTTLEAPPEAPPTITSTSSPTTTTIVVSWEPPPPDTLNGNLTGYVVTYLRTDTNESFNATTSVVLTITLSNLMPATSYSIQIAAMTLPGAGVFSLAVTQVTQAINAPTNPTATPLNTTTIVVSWLEPTGPGSAIDRYNVTYRQTEVADDLLMFEFSNNSLSLALSNLLPGTNYTFQVVAVTSGDVVGVASLVITQATPAINAPIDLTATPLDTTTILVSWQAPTGPGSEIIEKYNVTYRQTEPPDSSPTVESVNSLSLNISRLVSGTRYTIEVVAVSGSGVMGVVSSVTQVTYSTAPSLAGAEPSIAAGAVVTTTSIEISLPVLDTTQYSHVWIVVVQLERADDNLTTIPISAVELAAFSDNLPARTPYVVAQITIDAYPTTFILGGVIPEGLNENIRYTNGPLKEGTYYTAFVRAFSPTLTPTTSRRRQSTSMRQNRVFSNTAFLPVTATRSTAGLSGGDVAGIVIGVLLLVLLVGVVIALVVVVMILLRRTKAPGPPPSRKGSMRLRDSSAITVLTNQTVTPVSGLQDLNPNDERFPVATEEFASYVKQMHANTDHLFSEEYEILTIKSPSLPHNQCSMPYNVNKNRYANINCYDQSRVNLSSSPDVHGSDYINANYIDGYHTRNAYIATQGPLPHTTADFWQMVWEQQSCCVIMLTNLVEKNRAKCHQYWPEAGSVSFNDLTLTLIESQELAYYSIRTYRMNKGNDIREVKQFHYTGWPDFGVPDHPNPIISFIRRLDNYKRTLDGPDIVHCSAGVGRSGTLIAIQEMVSMMSEEGKIDIFNYVLSMRKNRNYMVQTERQYIFVHDTMLELMRVGETEIGIQSLRRRYKELQAQDAESEMSSLEEEFLRLQNVNSVIDEFQYHSACLPINAPKNRDARIIPFDSYRVRLLMHPGVSGSDYINAAYIDGYHRRHQYIVTQGPLSNTVEDMWRMVWEHRASIVMMLCQFEEKGEDQCAHYWPTDKIRQYGDLFVEMTQQTECTAYVMREFSITNTKVNESRMLKHFQYSDWPAYGCPPNAAALIDIIGVLQKTQHQCGGGPIVVHSRSPIARAGTFCILSNVLEQMKVEGIVDIFFAVHSLRQQQPGLVESYVQYKFCYNAVLEFLDSFDHYANFS